MKKTVLIINFELLDKNQDIPGQYCNCWSLILTDINANYLLYEVVHYCAGSNWTKVSVRYTE